MTTMLTIPEEATLLCSMHDPGSAGWWTPLQRRLGLAGGLVAELALLGRVSICGGCVHVRNRAPTGEPLLDSLAPPEELDGVELRVWVEGVAARRPDLARLIQIRLAERHVLRRKEWRVLRLWSIERYAISDHRVEQQVRDRVRAVLLDFMEPDDRIVSLIAVLNAIDLIEPLFSDYVREEAVTRARTLIERHWIGGPVADAVIGASAACALAGAAVLMRAD